MPPRPHGRQFWFWLLVTVLSYDAVRYMEVLPELIEATDGDPDVYLRIYAATIDIDLPADKGDAHRVATSSLWTAPDGQPAR